MARAVLLGAAVLTVLLLFVFPTRAYLAQQSDLRDVRREVAELERANDEAKRRLELLDTPSEIERIARARYNMVRPGEEAFTVVPEPSRGG